eukprot:2221701-Amphidinium_carterae.1
MPGSWSGCLIKALIWLPTHAGEFHNIAYPSLATLAVWAEVVCVMGKMEFKTIVKVAVKKSQGWMFSTFVDLGRCSKVGSRQQSPLRAEDLSLVTEAGNAELAMDDDAVDLVKADDAVESDHLPPPLGCDDGGTTTCKQCG